ncbi:STAS domain-containing protein, partial [Parabacteroides distasonis]
SENDVYAFLHKIRRRRMTIHKTGEGTSLTYSLEGRLDTTTAPMLEGDLKHSVGDITELHFDFAKLEYISSAGLRVLLSAQKVMNKQGTMTIANVNDTIMEIFEVTGFVDILTIV